MNIQEAITTFHATKNGIYRHEIDNFTHYITEVKRRSLDEVFSGIRTEYIIESLEYVINDAPYSTYSMANKYKSAISEFFNFLIGKEIIQNTDFYNELVAKPLNPISYNLRMNTHIVNHNRLKEAKTVDALSDVEAIKLIADCDIILEEKKDNITYLSGCLSIKVMLLTGIKFEVLSAIPFSAFSNGILDINRYKIHMPTKLNKQIADYVQFVPTKLKRTPTRLFMLSRGAPLGKKSGGSPLVRVMKELLGTTATLCLSKYGITNLINVDVNKTEISDLTAAEMKIISDCIQTKTDFEKEQYINSRLSKLDVFYKM